MKQCMILVLPFILSGIIKCDLYSQEILSGNEHRIGIRMVSDNASFYDRVIVKSLLSWENTALLQASPPKNIRLHLCLTNGKPKLVNTVLKDFFMDLGSASHQFQQSG